MKDNNNFFVSMFFDEFKKGGLRSMRPLFTDDVEFNIIGQPGTVPFAGTYRGIDAVIGYLASFYEMNEIRDVIEQFHLADNWDMRRATSHINLISDVPSTRKKYDLEFLYKWQLSRDMNKIQKLTLFYSTWHLTKAFSDGDTGLIKDQRGTDDFTTLEVDFNPQVLAADIYKKFYVEGDIAKVLEIVQDNSVVIEKGNPELPSNGVFRGPNDFQKFASGVFSFQIYIKPPTISDYVTQGNKTDATLDVHFGDQRTGKEFWITLNQSWIFDGKGNAVEFKSYHDSQEIWLNHLSD